MIKTVECILMNGINSLTDDYGIDVKQFDNRILLNYNQINSAKVKTNPIVRECRSLVLDDSTLRVISSSFYRFFNYGETEDTRQFNDNSAVYMEKADGSLIHIYYDSAWKMRTRGSLNDSVDTFIGNKTHQELVSECFNGDDLNLACSGLDKNYTHLFELTSPENRIVVNYNSTELVYLGRVKNGQFDVERCPLDIESLSNYSVRMVNSFHFSTIQDAIDYVNALDGIEEGLIAIDHNGVMLKIKNPKYLVLHHHLNKLSPRRIIENVLSGEFSEILAYFPQFEHYYMPYVEEYNRMIDHMIYEYKSLDKPDNGKDFYLLVKNNIFSSVYMKSFNGNVGVVDAFSSLFPKAQSKIFNKFSKLSNDDKEIVTKI